jgi:hypothetical protein
MLEMAYSHGTVLQGITMLTIAMHETTISTTLANRIKQICLNRVSVDRVADCAIRIGLATSVYGTPQTAAQAEAALFVDTAPEPPPPRSAESRQSE